MPLPTAKAKAIEIEIEALVPRRLLPPARRAGCGQALHAASKGPGAVVEGGHREVRLVRP